MGKKLESSERGTQGELVGWDEANEYDLLSSKYFKPEQNVEYEMRFSEARLVKRPMPVWEGNRKTDKTEDKIVLDLAIESINGKTPVREMIWSIKAFKLRNLFEPYARKDLLTKKTFTFKQKGEGMKAEYLLAAID